MHLRCVVELVVDLDEARVAPVAAHPADPLAADLRQPLRVDREADDLRLLDREQLCRRLDPLHERHVRRLVAEVAEVDRERRLRGPGHPDEDDVGLGQTAPKAVVVLDRELDRRHAPEVGVVQRRARARLHPRRPARHARDRVDRVAQ